MLSDEEKKAIEMIEYIQECNTLIGYRVEDRTILAKALLNLIEKQSKEIEELSDKLTEKICKGVEEEILEEYRQTIISKDKEIEELKAKNEERLTRLFEYEDRLEHYEYEVFNELNNYINMDELQKLDRIGLKGKIYISEDKIKAKIEEIDIEIQCCEYADDDTEEYKQDIEKEKRRLLRDKAVLQSLLEKDFSTTITKEELEKRWKE